MHCSSCWGTLIPRHMFLLSTILSILRSSWILPSLTPLPWPISYWILLVLLPSYFSIPSPSTGSSHGQPALRSPSFTSSPFSSGLASRSSQLLSSVSPKCLAQTPCCSEQNSKQNKTKLKKNSLAFHRRSLIFWLCLTSRLIVGPFPTRAGSDHSKQLKQPDCAFPTLCSVLLCLFKYSVPFLEGPSPLPTGKTHSLISISNVTATGTHSHRVGHFILGALSIPWTLVSLNESLVINSEVTASWQALLPTPYPPTTTFYTRSFLLGFPAIHKYSSLSLINKLL